MLRNIPIQVPDAQSKLPVHGHPRALLDVRHAYVFKNEMPFAFVVTPAEAVLAVLSALVAVVPAVPATALIAAIPEATAADCTAIAEMLDDTDVDADKSELIDVVSALADAVTETKPALAEGIAVDKVVDCATIEETLVDVVVDAVCNAEICDV